MQSNIIEIGADKIVVISEEALRVGSVIDFDIIFPKGAAIDRLNLNGVVENCCQTSSNDARYRIEVSISITDPSKQLILESFRKYLDREKQIGEMRNNLDLAGITEGILEWGEETYRFNAATEYIRAKIRKTSFH